MEETSVGMNECKSSNIKAYGWDGSDLLVEYLGGSKYIYRNVPAKVYEEMICAESKGSFMNSQIKNKYEYERLT